MKPLYRLEILAIFIIPIFFANCTGKYFRPSARQPFSPNYRTLSQLPYKEYWTGLVFNGKRIGFSHFSLTPADEKNGLYDIRSKAYLHIRFLMFDKKIKLKSFDQVDDNLSLIRFNYEYDIDGHKLNLSGQQADNRLEVKILTRGQIAHRIIPLKDKLYPTSVITLYPVMYGLVLDRHYEFLVYDGETQSIAKVKQDILAYEESELFPGQAFKVKTRLHGHTVTSWIDLNGKPMLEMSLGGVLISFLESKSNAQKFLTSAAINKDEAFLNFSLIRSNLPIDNPGAITSMEIVLSGFDSSFILPSDQRQRCHRREDKIFCRTDSKIRKGDAGPLSQDADNRGRYVQPSFSIPSRNPLIRQQAKSIVRETHDRLHQIGLLFDWIKDNIEQKPVDVFTALDVLEGRAAECQGHSLLYTALARAVGIPTRVVNGVVYSKEYRGFLYHTWAESLVDGIWMAVDPTFQQIPADATHIKFIEGELLTDLLPMVTLIGHIGIKINAMDDQ